jgi:hypothetical protein
MQICKIYSQHLHDIIIIIIIIIIILFYSPVNANFIFSFNYY